jgi:peroxiredoxin
MPAGRPIRTALNVESFMPLMLGDRVPDFTAASSNNPRFHFDTVAGRYIVVSFFFSSQHPAAAQFLREIDKHEDRFDVTNVAFFGVTTDRQDVARLTKENHSRLYFFDLDLAVSKKWGLVAEAPMDMTSMTPPEGTYTPKTFVLDQGLRIVGIIGFAEDAAAHVAAILSILDALPPLTELSTRAPVLIVPYVFEPEFCRALIDYYETKGGGDSGFMRQSDGKTVGVYDYSFKRRMDCVIEDQSLIEDAQRRISRRTAPAIKQAYQFNATRIERHIVACYDAAQGAHFKAHRDNTTLGTAHRRFAVTINLNSEDYEGGEIWFPEFGPTRHKPPSGWAIVFSCSLLHEVPRMTRGKRYAYLPFLYDDAAAIIRERNRQHIVDTASKVVERPDACNLSTNVPSTAAKISIAVLDGTCGCGNPNGCGTCLSAPAYPLDLRGHNAAADAQLPSAKA